MERKRSNILLIFFITAFFAAFLPFKSALGETGYTNPNAHECKKEEGSNKWVCTYNGKEFTWIVDKDDKISSKFRFGRCLSLPANLEENSKCLFCPLFLVLFNVAQSMSTNSFEALSPYMRAILGLSFAIWIAFVTLPTVSTLEKQDAIKYLKNVLIKSFKIFICFLFLTYPREFYRLFIDTILIAGMDFGSSFLFNVDVAKESVFEGMATVKSGLIGRDVYYTFNNLINHLHKELAFLMTIGGSTSCYGIISLKLGMALNGLLITFFAFCLVIGFGYYLVDAVIQIGIVGALMPILLVTYPFKATESYAKTGLSVFVNSLFIFMFMGVVISVISTLLIQSLVLGNVDSSLDTKEVIFKAFADNDVERIHELFDIGTIGGLVLLICLALAFKVAIDATKIAGKYSDGSGLIDNNVAKGIIGGVAKWMHSQKDFAKNLKLPSGQFSSQIDKRAKRYGKKHGG